MRVAALLTLAALPFATVHAEWRYEEEIDAITDEVKGRAFVVNELGHEFSVYKVGDKAWANFSISRRSTDQLDPETQPIVRVDKNKPQNMSAVKKTNDLIVKVGGKSTYEWKPKWINFNLSTTKVEEGLNSPLVELLEGEKITVRYYLFTGGYKDTFFSLSGARPIISKAVGIPEEIDMDEQARIWNYNLVYREKSLACSGIVPNCPNGKTRSCRKEWEVCKETLASCVTEAEGDADKLSSCLATSNDG